MPNPAGELKHGPNALVGPETPLVVLATHDPSDHDSLLRYSKVVQLLKDMRQQGAQVFALANEGDNEVPQYSQHWSSFLDAVNTCCRYAR